jgi:hypothetical protein
MGTPSWAIPVGVLCGIIAVGLVVLWWWFPRAWQKGVNSDVREATGQGDPNVSSYARETQRQYNRAIIERHERNIARGRGESAPANDDDLELALNHGREVPPPGYNAPPGYSAPPTMATGQTYVAN